jgi:hypothetical protein
VDDEISTIFSSLNSAIAPCLDFKDYAQYSWGLAAGSHVPATKAEVGDSMTNDSDRKATTASAQTSSDASPLSTSRRRALARLGLATAVAYSVPTLVRIDRSARAIILPTPCDDPPNFPPDDPPPFCPGDGPPP